MTKILNGFASASLVLGLLLRAAPLWALSPPAYVDSGATYQTASGFDTSLVVGAPASIVSGNLLVGEVSCVRDSSTASGTISPPAGWSATTSTPANFWQSSGPWWFGWGVWYKLAAAGDVGASTYTWTVSAVTVTGADCTAKIAQYSGVASVTPVNISTTGTPTATSPLSTSSMTTTVDNTTVLSMYSCWGGAVTSIVTPASGTTNRFNIARSTAGGDWEPALSLDDETGPSGGPGGSTTTRSASCASEWYLSAAAVAIAPGTPAATANQSYYWIP